MIAVLAGGVGFILYGSFAGGPLNPTRDLIVLAVLVALAMLLANGIALWRNLSLQRAEKRFKQQRATRGY
jgi:hypothetical protein